MNFDKLNEAFDRHFTPVVEEVVEESVDELPETCFLYLETIDSPIIVVEGESGYYPTNYNVHGQEARKLVAGANEIRGLKHSQVEAMKNGSMFGWDVPGADPNNELNQRLDSMSDEEYYGIEKVEDHGAKIKDESLLKEAPGIRDYTKKLASAKNIDEVRSIVNSALGDESLDDSVFDRFIDNDVLNKYKQLGIEIPENIVSTYEFIIRDCDPNDDSANTDKFESVETKQFGQLKEDVGDIDVDAIVDKFNKEYDFLYEHNNNVAGYAEARDYFDDVLLPASKDESKLAFKLLRAFNQKRQDIISSDREAAAFVFALDSLGYLDRIEMGESLKVESTTPSQQLKESSHSDEYSYKIGNNTYRFVCTSLGTRDGFAHRVKLFLNDNILSSARCDYLNRTWETFTYQSCMRKAITKAINNNSADKNDLAFLKDEIDNSISAGDR